MGFNSGFKGLSCLARIFQVLGVQIQWNCDFIVPYEVLVAYQNGLAEGVAVEVIARHENWVISTVFELEEVKVKVTLEQAMKTQRGK